MAYKSSARGTRPVRLVVLHTTEGAMTAASLGAYFYRDDVQASSHVGIGSDGVKQYVSYSRAAWTVRSGNPISDNAELCGYAHWTREQWLSEHRSTLDRAAAWVRQRCTARGIPIRKLTAADVAAGRAGVIGHVDWTNGMHDGTHTDPGGNFPWDYVIKVAADGAAPEEEDDMQLTDKFDEAAITKKPGTIGHALLNIKQNVAAVRSLETSQAAAIKALSGLVAKGSAGLTADQVEAAVAKAIRENVVQVGITVNGENA